MRFVIGQLGGDRPVTIIDTSSGKLVITTQPGYQAQDLSIAAKIMQLAVTFEKPGLTEATVAAVQEYVQEQIREHLGEDASSGTVLIL